MTRPCIRQVDSSLKVSKTLGSSRNLCTTSRASPLPFRDRWRKGGPSLTSVSMQPSKIHIDIKNTHGRGTLEAYPSPHMYFEWMFRSVVKKDIVQ